MDSLSLVGLKATSVVAKLAKDDSFYISSYNQPIGMVVSLANTKREFYTIMQSIAKELFGDEIHTDGDCCDDCCCDSS